MQDIKCVLLCLWEFKRIVYMNGRSIFIVIICHLLFVLHVEANLNSQRHSNAHLTIVSFLKGHTLQYAVQSRTTHEYYIHRDEQFVYPSTKSITQCTKMLTIKIYYDSGIDRSLIRTMPVSSRIRVGLD